MSKQGGEVMVKITIDVSEKEMDAIEDAFFTELSKKRYMETRPILARFWERLCKAVDKGKQMSKRKTKNKTSTTFSTAAQGFRSDLSEGIDQY